MIVRRIPTIYEQRKQRVAAYARVSTAKEQQEESLEVQERFYTEFIQKNERWEFVKVYSDEGRSGTSAPKRPGFQQMMKDALSGKIDIIFCKSISRFARNIVDAHQFVHQLKEHHVEVRFEKERVSSFDSTSDLVFNMLAAAAQEESRQISENMKWSYRKNAEKGIRHLGNNRILGYDEVDGVLTPNKDAWIVQLIFKEYAAGKCMTEIQELLKRKKAKRMRSDKPFDCCRILRILENEVYCGDRIIQKRAPQNYLTKKPDPSTPYESRLQRNDHPAIVERKVWDKAQKRLDTEREERANGLNRRKNSHFLYGLVTCSECGQPFVRKTVPMGVDVSGKRINGKVWACKYRSTACNNRRVNEEELMKAIWAKLGWKIEDFDLEEANEDPVAIDIIQRTIMCIQVSPNGVKVQLTKAA